MIETLEDWNARLACCCPMPTCPTPEIIYQRKPNSRGLNCGHWMWQSMSADDLDGVDCGDIRGVWGTRTTTLTYERIDPAGATATRTTTDTYSRDVNGDCDRDISTTGSVTVDPDEDDLISFTYSAGTFTWVYENYVGGILKTRHTRIIAFSDFKSENDHLAEMRTIAENKAALESYADGGTGATTSYEVALGNTALGATGCAPAGNPIVDEVALRPARFRFRIPTDHTGSFFKITYDVADFPSNTPYNNGDPDEFVSQDNVVEWTGPGDQEDPFGETWLTPWVELDSPPIPGERRVVNIRFICYNSRYGTKPQITGEGFTPPAP